MPFILSKYDTFLDFKYFDGGIFDFLSATALQALSLGLKVIDNVGKMHDSLPDMHRAENVIQALDGIYAQILES